MPYVTLKNGNRIEAVDEFTGLSMAIEADREERKIAVDLGDGGAPVELDGADEVARQAAAAADAKASAAQASAAANAQAIEEANAEISRVENKEDQAISGVRTDLATTDGKADANAAAVSGLDTRLGTAESTIAAHSASIATNADNINLVEAKATHADAEAERISKLIPNDATISNNLATKDFVNSTVATNTATFRGTYNSLAELEAVADADVNDYGFVVQTSGSATVYKRYKYDGSAWVWEYDLNNSSFTAAQWNAINSGADASKVAQIETNRLAIAQVGATKADASDVADLAGDVAQVETDLATKADAGDLAELETTVQQNTSSIASNTSAINNLATVARTGSYNDLLDKPTTSQVQADWDQSDSSAVDYIKNKPTIPTATSELTNDSGFLQNGASSSHSLAILGGKDVGENSVALGDYTYGYSANSVTLVGNGVQAVNSGSFATSIGQNSRATNRATSLGSNAQALSSNSIAIGFAAKVSNNANNAIQIGSGTNNEGNTLSVGSSADNTYKLLDLTNGLIPDERLSSNIARTSDIPSPVTVDQTYDASSTNPQSGAAIASAGFLQNVAPDGSSLAIGLSSSINDPSANSVALGTNASVPANGEGCVAIGNNSQAGGTESVAIGKFAQANSNGSIQIGRGTNNEASSLYIGLGNSSNYKLLDQDGIIPDNRISSNIARTSQIPPAVTVDQTFNYSSQNAVSGIAVSRYPFFRNNAPSSMTSSHIVMPNTAIITSSVTVTGVTSLGDSAGGADSSGNRTGTYDASHNYITTLGNYANARGNKSTAIGYLAKALAENAIQLGEGRNTTAGSLQVRSYQLLDSDGKIPSARLTTFTGADGSSAGTLGAVPAPTATDNTKFLRGDGTWAEAGSASADTQVINFQQIIYDENNGVAQWVANTDTETNATYPYKQTMRADCPFPVPLANSDYAKFLVSVVYPAKTVLGKELAPFVTFEVAYDLSTQKNYIAITHYSKTDTVATNYGDGYGRVYATIGVTYDDKRWNI